MLSLLAAWPLILDYKVDHVVSPSFDERPFERVLHYQSQLIAFFTGTTMDPNEYAAMRNDLLNTPEFGGLAPSFLKRHRDTAALWAFAKSVDPSWDPRRRFLREQFEPLLDFIEKNEALPSHRMPGPYDSSAWTGVQDRSQKVRAVQTLIPVAQAAVQALIAHLEIPSHNGGPQLDEVEAALRHLRKLHATLGALLVVADSGDLHSDKGEGLAVEVARYGRRAAKSLRDDPLPYAMSATLLGIFTACGFPGLGGYLSGMALAIRK